MKIAVVRVRGPVNVLRKINDTINMLRLYNKNYCVVVDATPQIMGMIKKVKDFVTYGEISEEFLNEIVTRRGELYKGREKDTKGKIDYSRKYIIKDGKKYNKYFRLSPPRKGYGREGIKKPFTNGGALGYRGEKIADLLRRMI